MTKQHAAAATVPPPLADDGANIDASADQDAFTALARGFVQAFNDRDAERLIALAHPHIVFRPTALVGHRRTYNGYAGLRRWVAELDATAWTFKSTSARSARFAPMASSCSPSCESATS